MVPKGGQNHNVLVHLRPAEFLEHPQILALLPAEPGVGYSLDVHETVELSVCVIPEKVRSAQEAEGKRPCNNSLGEQKISNLFQNICVGDTLTGIIESRCVDNGHFATSVVVDKANDFNLGSLRLKTVSNRYTGLPGENIDEL